MGIIFLRFILNAYADSTSEAILRLLIQKGIITQEEVDQLKAEIEAEKKGEEEKTLQERVEALEEKVEKKKGFLSYKGAEFELKGELEYEFLSAGGDASDDNAHFQLDKFVLQPVVKIGDNLKFDVQIYFQESKSYLNEFHAKFSGLPAGTWIDAGLYERWLKSHHSRKTEGYPLLGTAFYRDDALTITWGGEIAPFYWMLSLGNGYEIGQKQVAEDSASKSKIIHDNHSTSGLSDSLEYGINLGFRKEFNESSLLDILSFFYLDELSSSDISSLKNNLNDYTSNDDDKRRYGVGIKYEFGNSRLYGAYLRAEDGVLDRDSFFVEASHHFKFKERKWLTGVEPLISYGQLNVDNRESFDKPWSWDREKWILALLFDLYKNTRLKAEYYFNQEDTGDGDFDNDELLIQLEVKF